jgi:hypothetical protein
VGVELDHFVALGGAHQSRVDHRQIVAGDGVEVDRAQDLAVVPPVIDLVEAGDVGAAPGDRDESCYRRDVRTLVIAIVALGSPARADGPAVAAPGPPTDLATRELVLEPDHVEAAISVEANLGVRAELSPISVAPDLYLGATDRLTIGLVHSARALGVVTVGNGVCFSREPQGCERSYDNVGLDARFSLHRGAIAAAARVRLVASSLDPWKPSLRAGVLVRGTRRNLVAIADPQLQLGIANRELGNRDWFRIPLWLGVQPGRGWLLALRTGIDGELATFSETFAIPLGVEVTVRAHRRVDVALLAAYPSLLGPENEYRKRLAVLTFVGRWP